MKKRVIIALLLLIAAVLIVTAQFATTDDEYSRYNINWNGTSDFFGMAGNEKCVYSYDDLRSAESGSTLLIIAPGTEFAGLSEYLYQGNTIIIADQSGNANVFLEQIASSIRVHNEPVRSTSMEYKDMGIFRGTVEKDLFGSNVTTLTFDYPGYLTGGDVIAATSHLSWIDTNANNIPDSNETLKVYSLIASEDIGNGRIIVIADPSVFINSMLVRTHTENIQVINALLSKDLIIDQANSKTTSGGGLCPLLQAIHRYPALGTVLITILFILAAVIGIRRLHQ